MVRRALVLLALPAVLAVLLAPIGPTRPEGAAAQLIGGLVPALPRTDVPQVVDGEVYDAVALGDRIIVAGDFDQVRPRAGADPIDQPFIFAFFRSSGELDSGFRPRLDDVVLDLAVDGDGIFLGGVFREVDGEVRRKLARLEADGSLDLGFRADTDSLVQSVEVVGDRLVVGGAFTRIQRTPRAHLAVIDLATGRVDPEVDLPLSGSVALGGGVDVVGLAGTPDGQRVVVLHTARRIADETRIGVAVLDLGPDGVSVSPWRTRLWEDALDELGGVIRVTDLEVSPDGSYMVVTSTGGDRPPTGDTAVRLPLDPPDPGEVSAEWVSRMFDSVYAVAITDDAVYTGGHFRFQEAPGADEPWPGDDRNFGWGGDLGGAGVLGDQVVPRLQVGALEPDTGESLPWNPGADGFRGVLALTAIDEGLLLGHDGQVVGGAELGRFALFDSRTELAGELPDTVISVPFDGLVLVEGESLRAEGLATGTAGIQRVQIELLELESRRWLQPDGTLGSWAGLDTVLVSPGATVSDWSVQLSPPVGTYRVFARSFDTLGAKDPVKAVSSLTVRSVDADTVAPDSDISGPSAGFQDDPSIVVRGLATDDVGVAEVRVGVRNRDTSRWLQADGSWGSFVRLPAEVADPGRSVTAWSFPLELPVGRFQVDVAAVDTSGNSEGAPSRRRFEYAGNDEAPQVSVALDPPELVEPGTRLELMASATDDRSLARIEYRLRELVTGAGTQPDGALGGLAVWVPLPVDGEEATRSWTTAALPVGRWDLLVRAVDSSGQTSERYAHEVLVVEPGDGPPDGQLTRPADGDLMPAGVVELSGVADDDRGVERVLVWAQERSSGLWLGVDGQLGPLREDLGSELAAPGAAETSWSARIELGEGRWRLYGTPVDDAGQHDLAPWGTYVDVLVGDDEPPETVMASPLDGAELGAGLVVMDGQATDDEAVMRVQVLVRDQDSRLWLRRDGTWGVAQWHEAFVTNPGLDRTNWQLATPVELPPGAYQLRARAVDDDGRSDPSQAIAVITLR